MKLQIGIVGGLLAMAVIGGFVWSMERSHERATVWMGDVALSVRVADTAHERVRGLSGATAATLEADGMLFIFPDEGVRDFWMKDMEFAIDVIWVKDGKIAQIDAGMQPPEGSEDPERMSSNPVEVQYVIELPAGSVAKYELLPGQPVRIELDETGSD